MKWRSLLLLSILFMGCQEEVVPKKPDNLIPKEKMQNILYEVYILNAAKGINKKLLEVKGVNPERYVFEKYGIDSIQFAESNDYYAFYIEEYESMLDTIKYRLEEEKRTLESLRNMEEVQRKRVRDSLKELYSKRQDSVVSGLKERPNKLRDTIIR